MILYGSMLSPFVRKAYVCAAELGIAIDLKQVARQSDDPDFRSASPLGKMPALRDGDFTLADSTSICVYLDALSTGVKLIPEAARARAMAIWWDEFADTEMFACAVFMFFNRIVSPLFLKVPGNEAAAAKAEREGLPKLLDLVEASAPAEGYMVGEALSLADVALGSVFVNLLHLGHAPVAARHPRTAAYIARIHARPAFAATIARETATIERARKAA